MIPFRPTRLRPSEMRPRLYNAVTYAVTADQHSAFRGPVSKRTYLIDRIIALRRGWLVLPLQEAPGLSANPDPRPPPPFQNKLDGSRCHRQG